jgi:D-aspartate ligase
MLQSPASDDDIGVIPPRIDNSTPVLVMKLFHQAGLSIARSLGRLGVPVHAVHAEKQGASTRSRYCRSVFEWNLDTAAAEDSVGFLLDAGRRIGARPILIATDDATSMIVADNADALAQGFQFPQQPPGLARRLFRKEGMAELCEQFGVPTPGIHLPRDREDAVRFLRDATFPIVVKPTDNVLMDAAFAHRRTVERMVFADSAQEAIDAYDRLEVPESPYLMFQEYIPGEPDSVWMFDGYFDGDSTCRFAVTGTKLRQHPAYTGMTSLGICRTNPEVQELTKLFMKQIGYRGVLDCGYRYDARDGKYKLLDVNPRVGASFRLFVGREGMDVVRAMYLDLTDQAIPEDSAEDGRKWLDEPNDLVTSMRYWRDGVLGPLDWARSFKGVQETALFARDDLLPSAAMVSRAGARGLKRSWNGMRRQLGTTGATSP